MTHHIGPNVDLDRNLVAQALTAAGGREVASLPSRIEPGRWHRNGGGDRYRTDGRIDI